MATPLTVIVRFGIAVPWRRSLDPLRSARVIRTSASAVDTAAIAPTRTRKPTSTARVCVRTITSDLLVNSSARQKRGSGAAPVTDRRPQRTDRASGRYRFAAGKTACARSEELVLAAEDGGDGVVGEDVHDR